MTIPKGMRVPVRPAPAIRVFSVPKDQPVIVRFLGEIRGMLTHRVGDKPVHCLGNGSCHSTGHNKGTFWKGYAAAEGFGTADGKWYPCVLEITEHLELELRGRSLRGEEWFLERVKVKGEVTRVDGTYQRTAIEDELRDEFLIEATLKTVYHCDELRLDVPNPMEPRLRLEPSSSSIPILTPEQLSKLHAHDQAKYQRLMRKNHGGGGAEAAGH